MQQTIEPIDREQFEGFCALLCTKAEICELLGVGEGALNDWCRDQYGADFAQVFEKMQMAGRISLRKSQFKLAEKSATMAMFLDKQYIAPADAHEDGMKRLNKADEEPIDLSGLTDEQIEQLIVILEIIQGV